MRGWDCTWSSLARDMTFSRVGRPIWLPISAKFGSPHAALRPVPRVRPLARWGVQRHLPEVYTRAGPRVGRATAVAGTSPANVYEEASKDCSMFRVSRNMVYMNAVAKTNDKTTQNRGASSEHNLKDFES